MSGELGQAIPCVLYTYAISGRKIRYVSAHNSSCQVRNCVICNTTVKVNNLAASYLVRQNACGVSALLAIAQREVCIGREEECGLREVLYIPLNVAHSGFLIAANDDA